MCRDSSALLVAESPTGERGSSSRFQLFSPSTGHSRGPKLEGRQGSHCSPWPRAGACDRPGLAEAEPFSAQVEQGSEGGCRWARVRGLGHRLKCRLRRFGGHTDSGHRGCFPQPAFHEDGDTISPSPRICWNKALNDLKYLKQLKGRFCTARLSPSSLQPHRPATLPSTPGGFPQGVGERTELPFSLRPGTHPRQSPWVICPSLFLLCSFPPRDRRCRRTAAGSDPLPLLSPPPRSFRQ